MTNFKYKMTPEAKREIHKIAQSLPATFYLKGAYRSVEHTKSKIMIGQTGQFVKVDHFKEMLNMYRKNNDAQQIKQYVEDVKSIYVGDKLGEIQVEWEILSEGSKLISEGDDVEGEDGW